MLKFNTVAQQCGQLPKMLHSANADGDTEYLWITNYGYTFLIGGYTADTNLGAPPGETIALVVTYEPDSRYLAQKTIEITGFSDTRAVKVQFMLGTTHNSFIVFISNSATSDLVMVLVDSDLNLFGNGFISSIHIHYPKI